MSTQKHPGEEHPHHGNEKVTRFLLKTAYVLELLVSICLILGILCTMIPVVKQLFHLGTIGGDVHGFEELLSNLFTVVIGIEFLKMLCSYSLDSVIEVLLFTIARGMVLAHATPFDQLLSIAAIAILFVIRKFLFVKQLDKGKGIISMLHREGQRDEEE